MSDPGHIEVNVEEGVKFGVFANAFRVVEEVGPDCFLDFMVYSAAEHEATVVARVRVHRDFLNGIKNTLEDARVSFASEDRAPEVYRKDKTPVH